MAVDQDAGAEHGAGVCDQIFQRVMVGPVAALDTFVRLVEVQLPGIDFRPVRDHARDRAQACGDTRRAPVDEGG
jgi:predicted component of type VI protein secretion system